MREYYDLIEKVMWVCIVTIVATALTMILIVVTECAYDTKQLAMKMGYSQGSLRGCDGVYWVKCDDKIKGINNDN